MPGPETIDFAPLDGPAIGELRDLIVSIYKADGLEQFLKTKMNKDLYAIVDKNAPLNTLVFNLLDAFNRDGQITLLLRVIYENNPLRPDLREAIGRRCPRALEAPLLGVQVQTVVAGLGGLQSRVEENAVVRGVVTASRETLDQLKERIDILFHYKELHDCLHEIQLRHYQEVIGCAKQLGTDPQAPFELQQHILDLTKLGSRARKAAELLPDTGAGRAHVRRWVEQLESAVPKLRTAVRDRDCHGAIDAVSSFRYVIEAEQARVNARLNEIAEELPLEELSKIIENVVATVSVRDTSAFELQKAIGSLRNIKSQLDGRVAEHDQWQRIENDFWEAEDRIERKTPESLEEFKELWPTIRSHVDSLACAQAQSDWAKDSKEYSAKIDETIAGNVNSMMADFEIFRRNFRLFRDTALYHFFWVDLDLKAQCEEILKIREPLRSLLDKV